MINRRLIGKGLAKASDRIKNDDFRMFVDTSDEWIYPRTGIKTRYFSKEENTSDLGYRASIEAIKDAGIKPEEIDLIIVATMTGDNFTPSCASMIQAKLGLNDQRIMAFDINAACTGFVYALEVASNLLNSYNCALVVGSEVLSKLLDFKDRNTCVLFGDGAGAVILKKEEIAKECYFYSNSMGDLNNKLIARSLGKEDVYVRSAVDYLKMDGKEVFKFAVKAIEEGINEVLNKAGRTIDEIDLIIPHQANIRIIEYVCKKMKISKEKFYLNIEEFGNTSAASIPIALSEAFKEGKIKDNSKIVMVGFGGGFTYGSCYMEV